MFQGMKLMLVMGVWCLLLVLCWPLALAALAAVPIIWLFSLPLKLIAIVIQAVFALLQAFLFLPARLLGYKP
jgi:hypothetical protein